MPYLISLGTGLLAGILYSLLDVRSPAPPAIALIGLLGMLLGEQIIPVAKRLGAGESIMALVALSAEDRHDLRADQADSADDHDLHSNTSLSGQHPNEPPVDTG